MQEGLGIPTVNSLYEETHALNHTAMRLKNDALDNRISRESNLLRKRSSLVRAEKTHMLALNMHSQDREVPSFPDHLWDKAKLKFSNAVKRSLKDCKKKQEKDTGRFHVYQTLL